MIISHSQKFVFVKTRKTAGSSIEKYLIDNILDHQTDICTGSVTDSVRPLNCPEGLTGHISDIDIIEKFGSDFPDYSWFAIERNPWEKTVSQFLFSKRHKRVPFYWTFGRFTREKHLMPIDFERYSKKCEILIYKNLSQDLDNFFKQRNIPFSKTIFQKYNLKKAQKKYDYTTFYNERTKERIAQYYYREIESFKFDFK